MIIDKTGEDIFNSDADMLVNPVNCVGVSGKGLALEFKRRFPNAESEYAQICRLGFMRVGFPFYAPAGDQWICFFPTKGHWREQSKLEWIESGLSNLTHWLLENDEIQSTAIPALGCGLGGLTWSDVRPMIVNHMERLSKLTVYIYGPGK